MWGFIGSVSFQEPTFFCDTGTGHRNRAQEQKKQDTGRHPCEIVAMFGALSQSV